MTIQNFPFTIGDAVARARLDAGMSREALAVALDVGYRTICNWETDVFVPRDAQARALLGCQTKWAPGTIDAVLQDAYKIVCE